MVSVIYVEFGVSLNLYLWNIAILNAIKGPQCVFSFEEIVYLLDSFSSTSFVRAHYSALFSFGGIEFYIFFVTVIIYQ